LRSLGSNARTLYEFTRERLKLWDIPQSEVREIEKRGTPGKGLTLYSPIHGPVPTRNGFAGPSHAGDGVLQPCGPFHRLG